MLYPLLTTLRPEIVVVCRDPKPIRHHWLPLGIVGRLFTVRIYACVWHTMIQAVSELELERLFLPSLCMRVYVEKFSF